MLWNRHMKSSASESKPFQNFPNADIAGQARQEERLSRFKLKSPLLIDSYTEHSMHLIQGTVNSRYIGHPRNRDLVSVIARVRNSGVQENFYFKPYLRKGVTCVFIFISSSTVFRPVVASKERQNFIYKRKRT